MPAPRDQLKAYYDDRKSARPREYGIDEIEHEFVESLVEVFHRRYPMFGVDELLVRPREALSICDDVRRARLNYDIPDDVIPRALRRRLTYGE